MGTKYEMLPKSVMGTNERLIPIFGSKAGLYHLYPKPQYDKIIEPFAGGAGYSLAYFDREVILYELDPDIYGIWKYLQQASEKDILSLPDVRPGQFVSDVCVSRVEADLIGYWCGGARAKPSKRGSKWMSDRKKWFWGPERKKKIAKNLFKIRHWKIHNGNWQMAFPGNASTYFIDPPYMGVGQRSYTKGDVNFIHLSYECQRLSSDNQIIVCEGPEGNWLPFKRLDPDAPRNRSGKEIALSKEYIWTNE